MADPSLDEIRARRLAELQAQYGGGVSVLRNESVFRVLVTPMNKWIHTHTYTHEHTNRLAVLERRRKLRNRSRK